MVPRQRNIPESDSGPLVISPTTTEVAPRVEKKRGEGAEPARFHRATSAEFVASELRRAILEGELQAGERIHQEDWAERFGMSRAPLREGLKLLIDQALIRHDPNRGYFVALLPTPEVAQLYWLRIRVES